MAPHLAGLAPICFADAEAHVPAEVVEQALAMAEAEGADAIVSLGGGSATGLGKALRRTLSLPFVAIPTTYAGSEMTAIFGIRRGTEKQTGRDEGVRPDLVIHAVELTRALPRALTITSLMNALAHPISALSTGDLDPAQQAQATAAIGDLVEALEVLVARPRHADARAQALRGAARAAQVLDQGSLGAHHRLAHHLGGRLGAPHAALHAAILPHSTAALLAARPDLAAQMPVVDLPGLLFSLLQRVGAATRLTQLAEAAAVEAAVAELDPSTPMAAWARAAQLGRDPSARFVALAPDLTSIPAPGRATRAVVAVHGRGATAEAILKEARAIVGDAPEVLLLAPQAPGGGWYPQGYAAAVDTQGESLEAALDAVERAIDRAAEAVGRSNVVLLGFSQGACLAAEWVRRTATPVGGLVALFGAFLGPAYTAPVGSLGGLRAYLSIAEGDAWVRPADVRATAALLEAAGATVSLQIAPPGPHAVSALDRVAARALIFDRAPRYQAGFGNAHHTEALPGALPIDQNSPRKAPYGLYPEQINATGFVAQRQHNLRAWLYRIRPAAQHTPLQPLEHPTFVSTFDGPVEPNLSGWHAPEIPSARTDFVDGLITLGGAGSVALRRGWAAHFYVANASMDDRAFYSAESDLLIIPEQGRITLQTELGVLDLPPGQVAVVPRGIRFSVLLPDGPARGYVGEVFGRHFELPERGPVGANGLSDPRHFEAPVAWHEDRLHPGYRITARFGGRLFEATQDHSPYDVVAWHGNLTPYRYDLLRFSPVGNTRFDHPDPSIYTVLTAPLDELGSHSLDFVFFPPRWDVSEGTFRPPFFHRNATTELNGIIQDPSLPAGSPFAPGGAFLTPSMTPHGVVGRSVERHLRATDEAADRPQRIGQGSMWFQFESALPLQLTAWAAEGPTRRADWPDVWGVYRTHFTPERR